MQALTILDAVLVSPQYDTDRLAIPRYGKRKGEKGLLAPTDRIF
jgi:hypothetical protein